MQLCEVIEIIMQHLSKAIEYESRLRELEIYGPEQLEYFNQHPELKEIKIRQLQSLMDEVAMDDIRSMYREGLLVQAKQALEVLGYKSNGNENYSPPKNSSEAKEPEQTDQKFNVDSLAAIGGGAGLALLIKTLGPEIVKAFGEAFYEGQESAKYKQRVNHISQLLNGVDSQQLDYILKILTTTDPKELEAIIHGYGRTVRKNSR